MLGFKNMTLRVLVFIAYKLNSIDRNLKEITKENVIDQQIIFYSGEEDIKKWLFHLDNRQIPE